MGVELAARGDVEKLAIFHHDPNATDEDISNSVHILEIPYGHKTCGKRVYPWDSWRLPRPEVYQEKFCLPMMD